MLAAGFSNSDICVFSLHPSKLRYLKPPNELELLDKECGKRVTIEQNFSKNGFVIITWITALSLMPCALETGAIEVNNENCLEYSIVYCLIDSPAGRQQQIKISD